MHHTSKHRLLGTKGSLLGETQGQSGDGSLIDNLKLKGIKEHKKVFFLCSFSFENAI